MYPNQFLVYRPSINKYCFYSFIYDSTGNIVKIKCQPAIQHAGRIVNYENPIIHVVGIMRDNHTKFYDFYETGLYHISYYEPTTDGFQLYERTIPVISPETMAVMPQELSCEPALICA